MKKVYLAVALAALAAVALARAGSAGNVEAERVVKTENGEKAELIGPCTGCQAAWGSHD